MGIRSRVRFPSCSLAAADLGRQVNSSQFQGDSPCPSWANDCQRASDKGEWHVGDGPSSYRRTPSTRCHECRRGRPGCRRRSAQDVSGGPSAGANSRTINRWLPHLTKSRRAGTRALVPSQLSPHRVPSCPPPVAAPAPPAVPARWDRQIVCNPQFAIGDVARKGATGATSPLDMLDGPQAEDVQAALDATRRLGATVAA